VGEASQYSRYGRRGKVERVFIQGKRV